VDGRRKRRLVSRHAGRIRLLGLFPETDSGSLPRGTLGFTPIHISEYIRRFPPTEEVEVHRGAWNTEHHWGGDFTQWTGSLLQKKGFDEIKNASDYYWQVKRAFDEHGSSAANADEARQMIVRAYDRLLAAETSCNFYWGSRWVHRSFDDLEQVYHLLDTAMGKLPKDVTPSRINTGLQPGESERSEGKPFERFPDPAKKPLKRL
jgi:alpha-amylase/alpha-mannosidase (GH57 family)